MPWEGFNYEDGIVVSERLVAEDLLTTINITPVSYTHLDVYKRQRLHRPAASRRAILVQPLRKERHASAHEHLACHA